MPVRLASLLAPAALSAACIVTQPAGPVGGPVPAPITSPAPRVLAFDAATWQFYDNGAVQPRLVGTHAELIPDDVYSAAVAGFHRGEVRPPFAVDLDYAIWDDDAGPAESSADGIALMLLKSEDAYRRGEPLPAGSGRGVIVDGTGYAVHIHTYGPQPTIYLADGAGRTLASAPLRAATTGGQFVRMHVEVDVDGIEVFVDGARLLDWRGPLAARFGGLGIAAGTGAADSQHAIRDVTLSPLASTAAPAPVELVVNGGFEQPEVARGSWGTFPELPGWRSSNGRGIEVQDHVAGDPAEGEQFVELDGDAPAAIYQDLATRPGVAYQLRYRFSARPGTPRRDNRLEVRWNGQIVDEIDAGARRREAEWIERTVVVEASAPVSRLELIDRGEPNGVGTYVDDVSVVEVTAALAQ